MKKLKFTCTNCDAKLRVPTHLAGVSAPCPKCGATITAPSDITQAVDDDEPRRTSPSSPAPASAPRSPGRESSHSHAPSATAVVEPRQQVASGPATVSTMAPAAKATPLATPSATSQMAAKEAALPTPPPMPAQASRPLAELPKTTSSVEVPRVASRPLQPRPMTLPVADEIAPAFFTPPPPIMPLPPVAPEPAFPSEAPMPMAMPMPSATPVVVEVTTFPVAAPAPPPPASVITQPIRVKARSSDLPEVRAEVSGSGSLPRLDVSLAGHDASATALSGAGQSPRTRVQLSQPGLETHKFSPDDFIVPPTDLSEKPPVREEVRAETPPALDDLDPGYGQGETARPGGASGYLELPLQVETEPIPLEDLDDLEGGPEEALSAFHENAAYRHETPLKAGDPNDTYYTELPVSEPIPPDDGAAAWSEEELASDFDGPPSEEQPWDLGAPLDSDGFDLSGMDSPPPLSTQPQGHDFDAVDQYDEVPVNPLHAGSFGKLFSQQSDPSREGAPSAPPAAAPSAPIESASPAPRTIESLPSPIADQLAAPEVDVLEELFGKPARPTGESKGLSKTAVVMISCLVGAAAVAVLMVVFLWQVLGGLNPAEAYKEGSLEETTTESSTGKAKTNAPVNEASSKDAPAMIDPVAIQRESGAPIPSGGESESPALSIDERVQQIVNGTAPATGGSVIGAPGLDLIQEPVDKFTAPSSVPIEGAGAVAPAPATPAAVPAVTAPAETSPAQDAAAPKMLGPAAEDTPESAPQSLAAPAAKSKNYHPAASFAAPGPKDSPLMRTNDVIDAFLRAPDWETRLKYTYQGDSLRPAIEDYYKKWPDTQMGRYSLSLFQMEQKVDLGGPYWVYVVSTNDKEDGFPLIIRVEDGNLKIDWQIYSEFYDKHYARFIEGAIPRPGTFRVIVEQLTEYYGPDRAAFTDLDDYYVYQVTPPYGELNEFAFVKKDSKAAKELQEVVGLGKQPLAVIITLDEKTFAHGVKHFVITDYLTEGWFR